ncbi:MAG: helix-turn-helix domain-containing protein [Halioglobus sp.]|nr:helix-turn-helix domain-containing protein [Halioglobus sp.]
MPSPDVIEPIARALSIMSAMNQHRLSTISDLHRVTGLPKPTVHRILATLISCGYVGKDIDRSVYMLTDQVLSLSSGYGKEAWLLQVGTPVARRITQEVKWPVAIGIFDYNTIVVQYSTRPYSEFVMQGSTVNKRFNLFKTAMGQAYLGFCEETQLQIILQALRDEEFQEDCILESDSKIKRYIAEVKDRGYGLRVGKRGESTHMAIPIKSDHQVIGVIGLSVFSSCFNDTVAKEYLALLRKSAGEIVDSMDRMIALTEHSAT